MAKSLMLAAFLVCISCAFADTASVIVSATPVASPVQSSLPSSSPQLSSSATNNAASSTTSALPTLSPPMMSTPSPMSSPMPSPTPGPSPPPPDRSYIYRHDDGSVCIHVEAGIKTSVKYEIANGTNTTHFVVNGTAHVDQAHSKCNGTYAELVLVWDSNNLTFAFSATNTTWTEEGVTFGYKITPDRFPNYTGHSSSGVAMFGTSFNEGLLMGRNNTVDQSFLCNTSQTFMTNDTNTGNTTTASLTVRDLQMQAFYFSNSSTGHFDNAYECPTDEESTNKIVPIVVGAALAGLVIVVLIAYLIGRFRNRKQSSYEALS